MKTPPTFLNICSEHFPALWLDEANYGFMELIRIHSRCRSIGSRGFLQNCFFFVFLYNLYCWSLCAESLVPRVYELLYIFIESSLISAGGGEKWVLLQNLRRSALRIEAVYQTHARLNNRLRPAKPTSRCDFLADSLIETSLLTITSQYICSTPVL